MLELLRIIAFERSLFYAVTAAKFEKDCLCRILRRSWSSMREKSYFCGLQPFAADEPLGDLFTRNTSDSENLWISGILSRIFHESLQRPILII